MMAPTIRVDDEVYALLQSKAEAFVDTPNTVLRRLLSLEENSATSTANPASITAGTPGSARLARMLDEGLLKPEEQVIWERRNQGERHIAWILQDGRVRMEDGTVHDSPSGAARHVTGYEVNGWRVWHRARDGKSLDELWSESSRKRRKTDGVHATRDDAKGSRA